MADNYLEKRYEEVFGNGAAKKVVKHGGPSLNTLLVKNRSVRRFRQDVFLTEAQLRTIVEVNTRIASAMNRQALRFMIVRADDVKSGYEDLCRLFIHGQDWRIPPTAFIVVLSTLPEDRYVDIDLGISLQSMSLKAVELGFNCLIMGGRTPSEIAEAIGLSSADRFSGRLYPLALLAVGKSQESAFLKPVSSSDLTPYTKDGVHYVPKLLLDDIIL